MTNQLSTAKSSQDHQTLKSLLSKPATIERLAAIAPKYLSPDRLIKIMLLTVSRDSKLWRCTPQSMLAALMRVAQYGLEPDGRLIHLVPFKDQVNVILGWQGLVEVARRNGIETNATLVYEEDEFDLMPDDGTGRCFLKHVIDVTRTRTKIVGAYSRSRRIDGTGQVDYEWMSLAEIEAIRKRSQAGSSGPWVTDFGEMARKTVLRRHSKRWPLCAEDRAATEDDDAPAEIRQKAQVTSEPARPLFKRVEAPAVEEDDIPFDNTDSPSADIEVETEKKPEPQQKRKVKVEPQPPVPTVVEAEPDTNQNLAQKLKEWVEGECGCDFAIFKRAINELGWDERFPLGEDFDSVTEEGAAQLRNVHKTVRKAMEMLQRGEE